MGGNIICYESVIILNTAGKEQGFDSWRATGAFDENKTKRGHTWLEFDDNGVTMVADPIAFGTKILTKKEAYDFYSKMDYS